MSTPVSATRGSDQLESLSSFGLWLRTFHINFYDLSDLFFHLLRLENQCFKMK